MDYQDKYLKYKSKYLQLKEILEGGINGDFFIVNKVSLNNLSFTPIFNIHP